MQTITSAKTSNKQIAALFNKVELSGINLDIGGGKYDLVNDTFDHFTNMVYDPYNRSDEHNSEVLNKAYSEGVNSVTIANVLNVIDCIHTIKEVLEMAKTVAKGKPVYISIYEGDRSLNTKETTKGYQRNMPAKNYIPIIKEVFSNVSLKNGVITAL